MQWRCLLTTNLRDRKMTLPDELQSLAALKAKGALTEQEFAQAKAAVIAKYGGTSTATPVASASKTSAQPTDPGKWERTVEPWYQGSPFWHPTHNPTGICCKM